MWNASENRKGETRDVSDPLTVAHYPTKPRLASCLLRLAPVSGGTSRRWQIMWQLWPELVGTVDALAAAAVSAPECAVC